MRHHALPSSPSLAALDTVTATFKALADPTRARLVLALAADDMPEVSVGELVAQLDVPQSNVSRHLGILRAAGLVTARREANHVHYRLADDHVFDLVRQAFAHAEHRRLGLPAHTTERRVADAPVLAER